MPRSKGSIATYETSLGSPTSSNYSESSRQKKKRCCTWPIIVLVVVILAISAVLVWRFTPWEDLITKITPIFPGNDDSTSTTETGYAFNQCQTKEDCCNGLDGICDLKVNEVLFAATHNSYASSDTQFIFFSNHFKNIKLQLEAGYRGINVDVCNCGDLVFCHNTCAVARDPKKDFETIVNFLDENESEILLVTMEAKNNAFGGSGSVLVEDVYSILSDVDGLLDYLYIHPDPSVPWPTLRELRDSGKVSCKLVQDV